MSESPIERCTRLMLFQAQQDHATELVIGPSRDGKPLIRYKVAGAWHDWQSPGADLVPAIIAELGSLAAFTTRPFPKEGLIDVPYSGIRLLWIIRMKSADTGCTLTAVEQ
jgi:type II secretory ATPase GspE/PulE/Tfp pilus assembly ATPase PilB-like protein